MIDGRFKKIGTLEEIIADNITIMGLTDGNTSTQNISQPMVVAAKKSEPGDEVVKEVKAKTDGHLVDEEK